MTLDGSKTNITNSIIWNNKPNAIYGNKKITYSNAEIVYTGVGNIREDPLFVSGSRGNYYLSQIDSGQDVDSPCINAGNEIPVIGYEPQWLTTRLRRSLRHR